MPIAMYRPAFNRGLRREIERRTALPLRPATARFLLDQFVAVDEAELSPGELGVGPVAAGDLSDLDPSWAFENAKIADVAPGLGKLSELAWWRRPSTIGHNALQRLWRMSVAVGLAAARLGKEAGEPDSERLLEAGLLHGLGLWLVAAVDADWLAAWFEMAHRDDRRDFELRELGVELDELALNLAERLGCAPLVRDAIWLHADLGGDLNETASSPGRLVLIQKAYDLADRSPWGFQATGTGEWKGADSRLKMLVAEVQSRTGVDFVEADASPREESLTKSNARMRIQLDELKRGVGHRDQLLQALGNSSPADSLYQWAEDAALAFCSGPGATTAKVVWDDEPAPVDHVVTTDYPPTIVRGLGLTGYPRATLALWSEVDRPLFEADQGLMQKAWDSWAALVGSHKEQKARISQLRQAHRSRAESEEIRLRDAKLAALAEFAAGAGHELNNPLAVIVGRAQLLLVHETDPKIAKSLRAILTQAQRAHRILRDLMYVARPPEPRPRFCRPDEIVRASLRDSKSETDDREIQVSADGLEHEAKVWADPDGLRHLADTLVRNALEASPKGGHIRFSTEGDGKHLKWTVQDFGRGISAVDGPHLFDPFYCGRQAGRGLGMGLPRAARFVAASGGDIRWLSNAGQGTSFQVRLTLEEGPKPPKLDSNGQPDPVA